MSCGMKRSTFENFVAALLVGALALPLSCERQDGQTLDDGGAAASDGNGGSAETGGTSSSGRGGAGASGESGAGSGAAGRSGVGVAGRGGSGGVNGGSAGLGGGATGGAGSGGGAGGTGAAGTGGTFVDGGDCYTRTAPPPTSEVKGSAFDAWEGESAHGCWIAAQSFPSGCADAIVRGGAFTLTTATCTGVRWEITVGEPDHRVGCAAFGQVFTPANCWCSSGGGPDPGAGGAPGLGCDAGPRDAARNFVDASGE